MSAHGALGYGCQVRVTALLLKCQAEPPSAHSCGVPSGATKCLSGRLLLMCWHCCLRLIVVLRQQRGREGVLGCAQQFSLHPGYAHEFEMTQEEISEVSANEWCLLIWRAAAGHRHASTQTPSHTHAETLRESIPASTCLLWTEGFWP